MNFEYVALDAGKYIISFTPKTNGNDVRMLFQLIMYNANATNSKTYDLITYNDVPKPISYQFEVNADYPNLNIYLESDYQSG